MIMSPDCIFEHPLENGRWSERTVVDGWGTRWPLKM